MAYLSECKCFKQHFDDKSGQASYYVFCEQKNRTAHNLLKEVSRESHLFIHNFNYAN